MNIKTLFVKYIKLREKLDNGKIYKIVDNTNDNIYIGSTCDSLKNRLSKHKASYKIFLKGLINNIKSFDIMKNNNYKIELLENCDIKTKQELLQRERYYIENNECLNKIVPGRNKKEYYDVNKDKINIKRNQMIDCECGRKYTIRNKARHLKSTKHQEFIKSNN